MVIGYVDSFIQCRTSKRVWLPLSYKDSGLEVLSTFQVWARLFCRSMHFFVFAFTYLLYPWMCPMPYQTKLNTFNKRNPNILIIQTGNLKFASGD